MSRSESQKAQRKAVRELVGKAYERELSQALGKLEDQFNAWRSGKISCFELNDLIHEHHDGISRELWKKYSVLKPDELLPLVVARGIIQETELPEPVLARYREAIDANRALFTNK